jgi:hypothetical protein
MRRSTRRTLSKAPPIPDRHQPERLPSFLSARAATCSLKEAARLAISRQVADYSRQRLDCVLRAVRQFGQSIPEGYKRYLVKGLRETFGLIGVPIRRSMRSGSENPYAPKKRRG